MKLKLSCFFLTLLNMFSSQCYTVLWKTFSNISEIVRHLAPISVVAKLFMNLLHYKLLTHFLYDPLIKCPFFKTFDISFENSFDNNTHYWATYFVLLLLSSNFITSLKFASRVFPGTLICFRKNSVLKCSYRCFLKTIPF